MMERMIRRGERERKKEEGPGSMQGEKGKDECDSKGAPPSFFFFRAYKQIKKHCDEWMWRK